MTLTQTIDWPGRVSLRKAIAQRQVALAQVGVAQFRRVLSGKVQVLAWRVLAGQEKARALQQVSGRLEGLAAVLLQRDPAGIAPKMEAQIIRANALTLGAERAASLNELSSARFELNQLMGERAEHVIEVEGEKLVMVPPPPLEQLLEAARGDNFDLKVRKLDVEQQGFEVLLAQNQRWPSITVQPYIQRQTNQTRETQTGLGVSIPLPLWDLQKGSVESAKARQTQAEVLLNAQLRQLEREVATEASHYRIHVQELAKWPSDMLEEYRATAEEADEHFRLGAVPLSTYIELQRQYLESVKAVLSSQLGAIEARVALEQLTGRALER